MNTETKIESENEIIHCKNCRNWIVNTFPNPSKVNNFYKRCRLLNSSQTGDRIICDENDYCFLGSKNIKN